MRDNEKFKIEIPLNSVFSYGNRIIGKRTIMCVEDDTDNPCENCVFQNDPYCSVFNCFCDLRKDGKYVRFLEVREVLS